MVNLYKKIHQANETRPAEDIHSDGDMNSVRLRIWVNLLDGIYSLPYTLDLATRLPAYNVYYVY